MSYNEHKREVVHILGELTL